MKEEIRRALLVKDFGSITKRAVENKKVLAVLISLSYDKEDVLCWRAVEALGLAAGAVARDDPEAVRNTVQRLLWSIREESGGIGWSAPEMLGEIVVRAPRLCSDIPPIILSFHEEEVFVAGVLRAMGRIAEAGIGVVDGAPELARGSLDHPDPAVRGQAVYALGAMKIEDGYDTLSRLSRDDGRCKTYENHELIEKSVGEIARSILSAV